MQRFLLFLCFLGCGFSLSAQTPQQITLTTDKDNTLYLSDEGLDLSNGAGDHTFAGKTPEGLTQRGLLHFPVADSLPAGAIIDSVVLTLYRSRAAINADGKIIQVFRLLEDWGEGSSIASQGQGMGAPPEMGDATWMHTFYNTDFWQTPGGTFVDSASTELAVSGTYNTWPTTPKLIADVQLWYDQPGQNFGWILINTATSSESSSRFDTREEDEPEKRPQLTIFFTAPTNHSQEPVQVIADWSVSPNPFEGGDLHLAILLNQSTEVQIELLDVQGKMLETLWKGYLPVGRHDLYSSLEATAIAPHQVYLIQLRTPSGVSSKKMIRN